MNILGSQSLNPFLFSPFGCNYLVFKVNGENSPNAPYKPNFSTGNYMREYDDFLTNIGVGNENAGNMVTVEHYKSNCCFFVYDGSPLLCNNTHDHTPPSGQIGLELGFTSPLSKAVKLIAYQVHPSAVTIDEERNVKVGKI